MRGCRARWATCCARAWALQGLPRPAPTLARTLTVARAWPRGRSAPCRSRCLPCCHGQVMLSLQPMHESGTAAFMSILAQPYKPRGNIANVKTLHNLCRRGAWTRG